MYASKIRIHPASLGNKLLLTAIEPYYKYVNNVKTNEICGYKYIVALPEYGFDKLAIKIQGDKQLDCPTDDFVAVEFTSLEIKVYSLDGRAPRLTAKAEAVKVV